MITRRDLGWLGCGAVLAAAGCGHDVGGLWPGLARWGRSSRRPAFWYADRSRHRVGQCDADGLVVMELEVPAPVALAADPDGGVWVASAWEGLHQAAHALWHLNRMGGVASRHSCGRVRALVPDGRGGVLAREGACGDRAAAWMGYDDAVGARPLAWLPGGSPAALAVGASSPGTVWWLEESGVLGVRYGGGGDNENVATTHLPGGAQGRRLLVDSDGRGAWVLGQAGDVAIAGRWRGPRGGPRTGRSAELRRVWFCRLALEAGAAMTDRQGALWLADRRRGRILRLSAQAQITSVSRGWEVRGIDALLCLGAPERGGGDPARQHLWAAAGGGLLRLDARGRRFPGQGDLGWVVDLAPAT